ncbi:MAG: hypothetical protein HOP09_18870 [Hyphomicrobium sp.]|nr:hypothetical protein [Hyphomicrobium sp.]
MVALDIALSEDRIDKSDHSEQRNRLMAEAEDAATRLGRSRAAETATPPAPKSYRWAAIAIASLLVIGAGSVSLLLNRNDLRTNANPHANGRIPLPNAMAGAPQTNPAMASQGNGVPKAGTDGGPDVAAMVAKLESRVNAGNPSIDDVIMLARSYRVLNRDEESVTLYRKAQAMAPEDPAIKLVLASALVRSEKDGYRDEGEKIVDGLLAADPKKPEALWLKSIGLVRRHEIEAARKTLTQLSELVTENSDAKNAVTGLLKELATASESGAKSSPTPPTPVPEKQPGTEHK